MKLNNVLIACDSFKECMSAQEACDCIEEGLKKVDSQIQVKKIPVADGGEGSGLLLAQNKNLSFKDVRVNNQAMEVIDSGYYTNGCEAIIESALSIGIDFIKKENRNIAAYSSFGVGELILDAIQNDANELIVTLGGSGTNDGGLGMLFALGTKFYDKQHNEIIPNIMEASKIARMDINPALQKLKNRTLLIASDVENPFCGEYGATKTFARQKGANEEQVKLLEENMQCLANLVQEQYQLSLCDIKGSGAAGGLGGALALLGFQIQSGISLMLEATQFEHYAKQCDLIISGEGSLDLQSAQGKTINGIANIAKKLRKPCLVLSGRIDHDLAPLYEMGVTSAFSIVNESCDLATALQNGKKNLIQTSQNIAKLLQLK